MSVQLDKADGWMMIFHAGTAKKDGGLVSAGGRVLSVTARSADMEEARKKGIRPCGKD